jgi:hypothetical protein
VEFPTVRALVAEVVDATVRGPEQLPTSESAPAPDRRFAAGAKSLNFEHACRPRAHPTCRSALDSSSRPPGVWSACSGASRNNTSGISLDFDQTVVASLW